MREYRVAPPTIPDTLLLAFEVGLVRRSWSCGSDKVECSPEDTNRGYLHENCHWYWHLWTVEQDKIEAAFQTAMNSRESDDSP